MSEANQENGNELKIEKMNVLNESKREFRHT